MEKAHNDNGAVWSLDWHPLGHMLTSGSNDHSTKVQSLLNCCRTLGALLLLHYLSPHPARMLDTKNLDYFFRLPMRMPCLSAQFWTRNRPGDDMQDRYNLLADQGDPRHAAGNLIRPPRSCPPSLPPRPLPCGSTAALDPSLAPGRIAPIRVQCM